MIVEFNLLITGGWETKETMLQCEAAYPSVVDYSHDEICSINMYGSRTGYMKYDADWRWCCLESHEEGTQPTQELAARACWCSASLHRLRERVAMDCLYSHIGLDLQHRTE